MTRIPDKKNVKRNLPSVGQIRGARGLIGWTQTDLAAAAGLSLPTIARFETEATTVSDEAIGKMRAALEKAGVEFISENGTGPGVALKKRKKR